MFRWGGDDFLRKLETAADARILATATYARDRFRAKVGRLQPTRTLPSGRVIGLDPSKPGEPPKVVTGKGRDSIDVVPDGAHRFKLRVIGRMAALDQGRTPNVAARPWILPTLQEERGNLQRVAAGDVGPLIPAGMFS